MEAFKIEYYIDDNGIEKKFSSMNKQEAEEWKKQTEAKALSEYYNRKIKIALKKRF